MQVKLEVKINTIEHFKIDKIRIMRGHFLQLIEICWHQYQVIKADLFLFSEFFLLLLTLKVKLHKKDAESDILFFALFFSERQAKKWIVSKGEKLD
jgi:hypothetical protein